MYLLYMYYTCKQPLSLLKPYKFMKNQQNEVYVILPDCVY